MRLLSGVFSLLLFFQHSFGQATESVRSGGNNPAAVSAGGTGLTGLFTTAGGAAIPFANVLLLKAFDSSLVKAAVTDEKGSFQFDHIAAGKYLLRFSAVGYQGWEGPVFELPANQQTAGQPVSNLGTHIVKEDDRQMAEVVVRAQKPLYQQQTGGMVVNVESSVLTKGSSALEVLERSPGVVVDHQNNAIALNGKDGVTVMINGKLMRMPMDQLVILLGGMSADDIGKIELLTTPPAGYDAEGNGGIINIVLKKNKKIGTSGSLSLTGGYGWGEKGTASVNLAHNTGKVNVYGSYTFFHDRTYSDLFVKGSENFPPLGGLLDNLTWDTTRQVQNNHNLSIGLDATLSPKTTIGGNINYNNIHSSSVSADRQIFNVLPDSLLLFNGFISGINRWRNLSSSMYLEKKIRQGEQININLDWLYFNNDRPNEVQSSFRDGKGDPAGTNNDTLFSPRQRGYASTAIQVGVLKMDYSKQLSRKLKLETGVKGTYTWDKSGSGIESLVDGDWTGRSGTSNNIAMKEGIGAAYASMNAQLDPLTSLTAGARYEYSHTKMEDPTTGAVTVDRRLGVLFPSVTLSRKLADRSDLQLTYSKRISRPSYNDLASYIGYSGPIAAYTGNPFLRPTITNNLKLGYTYRGYSFSVMLSRDDYPITRYQLGENPAGNVLYILPQNLAYQDNLNFQTNLPFKVADWWTMNYGFVGGWRKFREDYTALPVEKTYFAYSSNFSETFKLPGLFSVELSGWYNSGTYNGTTKIDGVGTINAGVKKELKNNEGTLQLSVADLFRTISINGYHGQLTREAFATDNHFIYNTESTRSPIFKITYTRSFGSGLLKSQRKQASGSEEEKERVRQ
ncbi:MAG: outer membrane beta-barrel family protein [Puia sp.]|nr:outer membrane beta-barrel family protein [Puia sp.]